MYILYSRDSMPKYRSGQLIVIRPLITLHVLHLEGQHQ
jgi:hypothetical protein